MIVSGVVPGMDASVESLPVAVPGGAGLVMFNVEAATGVRILGYVEFKTNRYNGMVVAIYSGMRMFPLTATGLKVWLPNAIHRLIDSGFQLASLRAVCLSALFNGSGSADGSGARHAALASVGSH